MSAAPNVIGFHPFVNLVDCIAGRAARYELSLIHI